MYSSNKHFKTRSSKREQVKHKFKSCDRYGSDVGFQIGGEMGHGTQLNTICGSFTHIIVLITIFFYGLDKFTKLVNHDDTQYHQNSDIGSIDSYEVFTQEQLNFNVAVNLV